MESTDTHQVVQNTSLLVMGLLFTVLFQSPLKWLYQSLQTTEYGIHSILLIGFLVWLGIRSFNQKICIRRFQLAKLPSAIFACGIIGFLATEKFIDADMVSCLFLGLAIYGFTGFVFETNKWKSSFPLVLLFIVCLPFSYHIETFLGFPLRVISAKIAKTFLAIVGLQVQSTETILHLENSFAHIDLPCSGIKSLWSITLLSIILSLIEKFKINTAWVVSLAIGWLLVVAANIFRIIMLVLLSNATLPKLVMDSIHSPLGLVGFLAACCISYFAFMSICRRYEPVKTVLPQHFNRKSAIFVTLVLTLAISINELYLPAARAGIVPRSAENTGRSLDLTSQEKDFFLRNGVISYQKSRFDISGFTGTAFLVLSKSWRGHHHPEQCLQGQGHTVALSRTLVIRDDLPVRDIRIEHSPNEVVYWFQSATDSTDDYSSRIWSGLLHPDTPYVMVCLYIDGSREIESPDLNKLITDFHRQARTMLKNEGRNET